MIPNIDFKFVELALEPRLHLMSFACVPRTLLQQSKASKGTRLFLSGGVCT